MLAAVHSVMLQNDRKLQLEEENMGGVNMFFMKLCISLGGWSLNIWL